MVKTGAKHQRVQEKAARKATGQKEESVLIWCSTANVNVKTAGIRTKRRRSPLLKKRKVEKGPQLQQ